jgi:hypothetical protein
MNHLNPIDRWLIERVQRNLDDHANTPAWLNAALRRRPRAAETAQRLRHTDDLLRSASALSFDHTEPIASFRFPVRAALAIAAALLVCGTVTVLFLSTNHTPELPVTQIDPKPEIAPDALVANDTLLQRDEVETSTDLFTGYTAVWTSLFPTDLGVTPEDLDPETPIFNASAALEKPYRTELTRLVQDVTAIWSNLTNDDPDSDPTT